MTRNKWLAWAAVILTTTSAVLYVPRPPRGVLSDVLLNTALLLWILGAVAVGATLEHKATPPPRGQESQPIRLRMRHWLGAGTGILCLLLLTLANTLLLDADRTFSIHVQVLLLFAGIGLLGWGVSAGMRLPSINLREELKTHRWLLLITLLGFILRASWLGYIHTFVDEMHFVEPVTRVLNGTSMGLLQPLNEIASFTALHSYSHSWGVRLLGRDFAGVRIASALVGTLTIPATYMLARALFDRKTALVAALMLATFPPHIHFSRSALNNIADPLFGVLALGLLLHGTQQRARWMFVWAGVCLGLVHYFYEGGRLVFSALVLLAPLWLPVHRQWRRWLLGLVVAALVAAPVFITMNTSGGSATPRLSEKSLEENYWINLFLGDRGDLQIQTYINNRLGPSFLIFVHQPESNGQYYGGETPLVLAFLVPALQLGTGVAAFSTLKRHSSAGVLLLWVGGTIFGNTLIQENTWAPRFVLAFPAIAILIGAGLRYTVPLITQRRHLLTGIAVLLAAGQMIYYVGVHLPAYQLSARPQRDFIDVAWQTPNLPPDTHVILVFTDIAAESTIKRILGQSMAFLGSERELDVVYVGRFEAYFANEAPEPDTTTAWFIDPNATTVLDALQNRYGPVSLQDTPFNTPPERAFRLFLHPSS